MPGLVWPLVYLLLDPRGRDVAAAAALAGAAAPRGRPRRAWPVLLAAAVVDAEPLLRLTGQYHGRPSPCYPLFEKSASHLKADFDVVALDEAGRPIAWDEKRMMDVMTRPRYTSMCRIVGENRDPEQLHAFWEMLTLENPQLKDARAVQFWVNTRYSAPEQGHEPPVKARLVHQAKLVGDEIVPDTAVTSSAAQLDSGAE